MKKPEAQRIHQDQHGINPKLIDRHARTVIETLLDAGYDAYLVGGCVRDLILGKNPKDFDVATNALPEQIAPLFRRGRIIGKRFRLVHVRFGREVIEVATFRAGADMVDDLETTEAGRIIADNVYGEEYEDAFRRDFTINALFYDIRDDSVLDYVGGFADLQARKLHVIGDPEKRFREDAVRMLRAIRFSAKLGLGLDGELESTIRRLGYLLEDQSRARLFDEVIKLLQGGAAIKTMSLLCRYGFVEMLFPVVDPQRLCDDLNDCVSLLCHALRNTDARIHQGKSVTPAFMFAALLWEPVRQRYEELLAQGEPPITAMDRAAMEVLERQASRVIVPKRFSVPMRDIWTMQLRLLRRGGRRAFVLLSHRRFRAAYDFLLLRCETGQEDPALAEWWTRFQDVNDEERTAMVRALQPARIGKSGKSRRKRRRRVRKRPSAQSD